MIEILSTHLAPAKQSTTGMCKVVSLLRDTGLDAVEVVLQISFVQNKCVDSEKTARFVKIVERGHKDCEIP